MYSTMPLDPKKLWSNHKICPCIDRVDTDAPEQVVLGYARGCSSWLHCQVLGLILVADCQVLGLILVAVPGAKVDIGCTLPGARVDIGIGSSARRVGSSMPGARVAR